MSRQSSLVEDRISSDEDEFQEERSGRFQSLPTSNRAHCHPGTHHHHNPFGCHTNQQTCTSSLSAEGQGAEYWPTKREPPEPDLIREILAQQVMGQEGVENEDEFVGINLNTNPLGAVKVQNGRIIRPTSALLLWGGGRGDDDDGDEDGRETSTVEEGRSKKRKRFKLRSCLIRSCISH